MANEFVARQGIIALSGGAQITGSLLVSGSINATGHDIIARSFTGSFSGSIGTADSAVTASYVLPSGLPAGTVSSSAQVNYSQLQSIPSGIISASSQVDHDATTNFVANEHIDHGTVSISAGDGLSGGGDITSTRTLTLNTSSAHFTSGVKSKLNADGVFSSSAQVDVRNTTGIATLATTGSNTFVGNQIISGSLTTTADTMNFNGAMAVSGTLSVTGSINNTSGGITGSFKGDGSQLTGIATTLSITGSTSGTDSVSLTTDGLVFSGSNNVTATVTNNTVTIGVSGLVSASSQISYTGLSSIPNGIVSSSGQVDHDATTNFVANEHIDHSTVSINAGSGLSGGGDITSTRTLTLDTSSAHFTSGVKAKLNTEGVFSSSAQVQYGSISGLPSGIVSSSGQIDVRNTTGITTIATTGSNTFTGVQTISNTTNSTNYTDGALIVQGGVGITKDVNISGSLTVVGLLTAVSMSTQYVTSSEYTVGTSRIILNDDDLVRFSGISVIDSGSTYGTGSLLWDSLNNRWIYETDDQAYTSAVSIAGPKNTGALGDEVGLVIGRVPIATGDHNIDTAAASSSIRIDFSNLKTHIENGLYVTGSVSSSVGFWGDGSNLTGISTDLYLTGSTSGTGTVALKTQGLIVSGTNGITATVSGQTVTISGSNATTTTKGVASFNSTNFTVTGGEVTSNNITINGTAVTLGGTRNITLQDITTQGATTTTPVTLGGGATIGASFQTSSTYTASGPTTNEVVLSLSTGSYDAAHFDYVIKNGVNLRTGTVMTVWNGASIEFTDTSTNDIGNTSGANFTADTNSANVRLKFTVSSGTWTIKTTSKFL